MSSPIAVGLAALLCGCPVTTVSGSTVSAGLVSGGYDCSAGGCSAIPGATWWSNWDDFHLAFDQQRTTSYAKCRLSAGYDDGSGANAVQHGIMCVDYDGPERLAVRHLVEDGFVLMGR